ncbi:HAD family hydrolase [Rothia sp. P6271]|uniref:HAD family hydrolase n=1 Tax=Rothia sp. P6271 TaxID=3402659 RepID=UPI003ACC6702
MSDTQYLTPPEAVFFDHDGTLVDTEPIWEQAKQAIAQEHHAFWTAQDTADCLGKSIDASLIRLQENGVPLELQEMKAELQKQAETILETHTISLIPGIPEVLQELRKANIPVGIVTNAITKVAEHTASLSPETFSVIIGDQQVTNPKPHPEPYLQAAKQLGVNPQRCVAVEDSPSGVQSALSAGMKVVIVPGEIDVIETKGTTKVSHANLSLKDILILSNS